MGFLYVLFADEVFRDFRLICKYELESFISTIVERTFLVVVFIGTLNKMLP